LSPSGARLRLLAISGSLRARSSNTELLRAAALLAPTGVEVSLYEGLGDLPHFNPDLEENEPAAVTELRARIRAAEGLLISSPEYAHGVPGVLKNMLDWLVGGEEFVAKPVALLNASPRATHAQASLLEIVRTMSARVVSEASIAVPLLARNLDAAGIAADPELAGVVRGALAAFARAIEGFRAAPGLGEP
jgi:NAD(P)H-dependent FMN reductase